MKRVVLLTLALGALLSSPAVAEDADEHSACMSDAFRVCWREIPNRHAVYLCLVANKNRLSDTCRTAIVHSRPLHPLRRHGPGVDSRAQYRHYFYEEEQ